MYITMCMYMYSAHVRVVGCQILSNLFSASVFSLFPFLHFLLSFPSPSPPSLPPPSLPPPSLLPPLSLLPLSSPPLFLLSYLDPPQLAGQSNAQMPVREVKQFHFLKWPDHGVPHYATAILHFRKRVHLYHPEKRGPMVVHCRWGAKGGMCE